MAFHPAFSTQQCRWQPVGAELQRAKNLVLDGGFNHGLTSTSTQWEVFAGFTYLLPHKLALGNHVKHESRKEPIQAADRRHDRIDW